jgi:hypothetical protein
MYHYHSGEAVMEGDCVVVMTAGREERGTVLHVLAPGSSEAGEWAVPEGGVMIEGGGLGLFLHCRMADDPDVVLVHRRG